MRCWLARLGVGFRNPLPAAYFVINQWLRISLLVLESLGVWFFPVILAHSIKGPENQSFRQLISGVGVEEVKNDCF